MLAPARRIAGAFRWHGSCFDSASCEGELLRVFNKFWHGSCLTNRDLVWKLNK